MFISVSKNRLAETRAKTSRGSSTRRPRCHVWESCLQALTLVCWFSRQSIARQVQYAGRRSQVPGRRSQVTGRRSQVAGRRSQVAGPRSQVPSPRSQVAGRRSQLAGHRKFNKKVRSLIRLFMFICFFHFRLRHNQAYVCHRPCFPVLF